MDKIDKLRYIYIDISKSKNKLLNILLKSIKILNMYNNSKQSYYSMFNNIPLLNFQELDSYCEGGYFPKDEYIFHNFISNKIKEGYKIKEVYKQDRDIHSNITFNYYILIFILFSSNEEIYNKSFKNILTNSKEYYIKQLIKYILNNLSIIKKKEEIDNIQNIIFNRYSIIFNISFQGLFFFNYQLLLYDILYDDNINKRYKSIILYIFLSLLSDILETIFFISFLPFTIISNKILNNTNFYYTFLDKYEGYFLKYLYNNDELDLKNIHLKKYQ